MRRRLIDIARVLRSKNAGPFAITLDVILPTRECFEEVASQLTPEVVARAYRLDPGAVLGIVQYPVLNALKINIRRSVPAGEPGDTDVYGAQQHVPLGMIEVEVENC
ncbi:MAG: DUF4387 domain-containing protein [Desulfurococcales archaeon]|nr:DUF4387 domain-containing protein [Desulfurococcales archaeon]